DALLSAGAEEGCSVTIGDVSFDWEPQTPAGVDLMRTGRGTDIRLESDERVGAAERKYRKRVRRGLIDPDEEIPERPPRASCGRASVPPGARCTRSARPR